MNEAQTRFNKIDPKLRDAGWGIVPGSKILVEQSASAQRNRPYCAHLDNSQITNAETRT